MCKLEFGLAIMLLHGDIFAATAAINYGAAKIVARNRTKGSASDRCHMLTLSGTLIKKTSSQTGVKKSLAS